MGNSSGKAVRDPRGCSKHDEEQADTINPHIRSCSIARRPAVRHTSEKMMSMAPAPGPVKERHGPEAVKPRK